VPCGPCESFVFISTLLLRWDIIEILLPADVFLCAAMSVLPTMPFSASYISDRTPATAVINEVLHGSITFELA